MGKKQKKSIRTGKGPESMVFEFSLYTQLSKVKIHFRMPSQEHRAPAAPTELSSWKKQDISSLHSAVMYLRSSVLGKMSFRNEDFNFPLSPYL